VIPESGGIPTAFPNNADEDRILVSSLRGRRAVTNMSEYLWKDGIIPYRFSESVKEETNVRQAIIQAISVWQNYTCLRFVPLTEKEMDRDHLLFTTSEGNKCSTDVGRMGNGSQAVHIGTMCRPLVGVAMHELGHSIGFWHEHTRPDRDSYVKILENNIKDGQEKNFEKREASEIDSLGIPYDLDSIMHYKLNAFSKNGEPTMRVIGNYTGIVGQRLSLSDKDILQANKLYKCEDLTRRRPIGCNGEIQKGNTIALRIEQQSRGLGLNWLRCEKDQLCSPTDILGTCAGYQFDGDDWKKCKNDTFRIYSRNAHGLDETIHIGDTVVLESGANSGYWLSCRDHKCKLIKCDNAISDENDLCPGRYFIVIALDREHGDVLKDQQTIGLVSSSSRYFSCKHHCRMKACSSDLPINNKQGNWTDCVKDVKDIRAQFTITKHMSMGSSANCTFASDQ
jgi:hypothetical protein